MAKRKPVEREARHKTRSLITTKSNKGEHTVTSPSGKKLQPTPRQATAATKPRTMAETMDLIAGITDETDTDELWTEGMRDMDAQRPEGQKLFEGMY